MNLYKLSQFTTHAGRVISTEASNLYDLHNPGDWRYRCPIAFKVAGRDETLTFQYVRAERDREGDITQYRYESTRRDGKTVYCNIYND